jgi:hypothetical protein
MAEYAEKSDNIFNTKQNYEKYCFVGFNAMWFDSTPNYTLQYILYSHRSQNFKSIETWTMVGNH